MLFAHSSRDSFGPAPALPQIKWQQVTALVLLIGDHNLCQTPLVPPSAKHRFLNALRPRGLQPNLFFERYAKTGRTTTLLPPHPCRATNKNKPPADSTI